MIMTRLQKKKKYKEQIINKLLINISECIM